MYTKIMVPVDLAQVNRLGKALNTAADLAKHYGIPVCYVGISASTPGSVAHTPAEFTEKLEDFGRREAAKHGHETSTMAVFSHDPTADLEDSLLQAVKDTGADLVIMASHIPNIADFVWPPNGGKIASHSDASVFVVRAH
jgi:nucleotide-binding universal stress UspA family protein